MRVSGRGWWEGGGSRREGREKGERGRGEGRKERGEPEAERRMSRKGKGGGKERKKGPSGSHDEKQVNKTMEAAV